VGLLSGCGAVQRSGGGSFADSSSSLGCHPTPVTSALNLPASAMPCLYLQENKKVQEISGSITKRISAAL
jgi:hypothetical protein